MDLILASLRDRHVKAKQLRRLGVVPCVIYGSALENSISIQIPASVARQIRLTKRNGSLMDIQLEEKLYHTLIKDLAYNNLTDEVVHISFQSLEKGRKANSVADIVLLNRDKVQGVLEQIQMQIPYSAETEHLIDTVVINLEPLPIGTVLTVGDIPELQSDQIELKTDPGNIVLRIVEKRHLVEHPSESAEESESPEPPESSKSPASEESSL